MAKAKRTSPAGGLALLSTDLMLEAERFLDRLAVGTWMPNIDLCETPDDVVVRIELPGVAPRDVKLTIQSGKLRVQGIKRESNVSPALVCYYCLERSYGKFDREIPVHSVVDARRARGYLDKGVLTIRLPKLAERRGEPVEIPILTR